VSPFAAWVEISYALPITVAACERVRADATIRRRDDPSTRAAPNPALFVPYDARRQGRGQLHISIDRTDESDLPLSERSHGDVSSNVGIHGDPGIQPLSASLGLGATIQVRLDAPRVRGAGRTRHRDKADPVLGPQTNTVLRASLKTR